MDPIKKKEWVDALRSGKYEQGYYYLHKEERYCCLGVLCEINNLKNEVCFSTKTYVYDGEDNETTLPGTFAASIKLKFNDINTLIGLNDTSGYSFQQIADWIEKNL